MALIFATVRRLSAWMIRLGTIAKPRSELSSHGWTNDGCCRRNRRRRAIRRVILGRHGLAWSACLDAIADPISDLLAKAYTLRPRFTGAAEQLSTDRAVLRSRRIFSGAGLKHSRMEANPARRASSQNGNSLGWQQARSGSSNS